MTPKQRARKVKRIFELYEAFYVAANDYLREDDEVEDFDRVVIMMATDHGHFVLRNLRATKESDASRKYLDKHSPDLGKHGS